MLGIVDHEGQIKYVFWGGAAQQTKSGLGGIIVEISVSHIIRHINTTPMTSQNK